MRFQIVHSSVLADGVFIRVRANNNEIVLAGEMQSNVGDAKVTIMRMKEDAARAIVEEVDQFGGRTVVWEPEDVDPADVTGDGTDHTHPFAD